jgi:hypothetical protein
LSIKKLSAISLTGVMTIISPAIRNFIATLLARSRADG